MSNIKIEKSFSEQPSQSGLKKLLRLLEDAQNFTNKGLHTLNDRIEIWNRKQKLIENNTSDNQ